MSWIKKDCQLTETLEPTKFTCKLNLEFEEIVLIKSSKMNFSWKLERAANTTSLLRSMEKFMIVMQGVNFMFYLVCDILSHTYSLFTISMHYYSSQVSSNESSVYQRLAVLHLNTWRDTKPLSSILTSPLILQVWWICSRSFSPALSCTIEFNIYPDHFKTRPLNHVAVTVSGKFWKAHSYGRHGVTVHSASLMTVYLLQLIRSK